VTARGGGTPSVDGRGPGTPGWWSGPRGFPPAPAHDEADLVVVGLGGSGLAAVHRGLELGWSVVGLEAGAVAGGAAGRNGGFLLAGMADFHHDACEAFGRAEALRCFRLTEAARDRMIAETPACVRRIGSLRRPMDGAEEEDARKQRAAMRRDGLEARWVDEPDGRGLLVPGDAAFDPDRRCRALAARARRAGARLYERSPVREVEDGRVRTETGSIRGRRVVVAIDAGAPELGLALGIRPVRLQMLSTAPAADAAIRRAVYARYGYDYWQQAADGRVHLGGGRDRDPEPSGELGIDARTQAFLERTLRTVVGTQAAIRARWAGRVGYTADARPRLARVSEHVAACGGYSGTGNVVGWALARAAVDWLASGARPEAARLASVLD